MKQTIKVLALVTVFAALFAFGTWLVWFFGMVCECQYPYALTLMRVQNAKSVTGVPVSEIIKGDGAKWPARLPWHTCSYCADWCGDVKGLICVTLSAPDKSTIYHFAYSRETRTLVPLTGATATHYPAHAYK
jgi:hypothetical protein